MKKPSAATVIATLTLFVALGGTSYAAVALAPNSVGSAQIKDGAVQSSDIKDGAVISDDIANGAIGSDDIKSGSIQVSDLSKGAMNGLDGKDGAQGPAGPAGPKGETGAQGPAGPAGSSSGGGGGVTIRDADGNVVSHVLSLPAPDANPWTGAVNSFYRYVDGDTLLVVSDGSQGFRIVREVIFFLSADCSGPAYVQKTASGDFPAESVGDGLRADYNVRQSYKVSGTTVHHVAGGPVSGYDSDPYNLSSPVDCTNSASGRWMWANRANADMDVLQLTPVSTPSPLHGPFTYDRG